MKALTKVLAGGIGLAALGAAAPAAAQYYPQPYGGYGNNVVGQVIGQILNPYSYGRYPVANYGYNQYANQGQAVDQCARAVEARLNGYNNGYYGYGNVPYQGGRYGYNGGYGYNGYNGYNTGGRVQGITRVDRKSYGLKVFGVASSGYNGYQGYGQRGYGNYGYNAGADLSWNCEVRYDGRIRDIDVNRRTAYWRGY